MPVLEGLTRPIGFAIVRGGAAGLHGPVSGLDNDDTLISVRQISDDLVTNVDLTAEFTIDSDATIDNTAGTATTGDFLLVTWQQAA